jgi:ribokinase
MKPIHLSVGRINIDILVKLDRLPEIDEALTTDLLEILPGGAAVNYSVAVTKLGHSAKVLAKVGKDQIVSSIMEKIVENGVGLDYVEEVDAPPSVALIFLRTDGKISMVRRLGASTLISKDDVNKLIGMFDVIHFASIPPSIVIRDPYAKLVTYDPGPFSSSIDNVDVDILYVNEREYQRLNGKRINARWVVVKMGSKGAKLITENQECEVEAYKVNVIDTTGAGDVFDATFNYCYLEGCSIEESLQMATVASALKVTRIGGISSPTKDEIREVLKNFKPKVVCK